MKKRQAIIETAPTKIAGMRLSHRTYGPRIRRFSKTWETGDNSYCNTGWLVCVKFKGETIEIADYKEFRQETLKIR